MIIIRVVLRQLRRNSAVFFNTHNSCKIVLARVVLLGWTQNRLIKISSIALLIKLIVIRRFFLPGELVLLLQKLFWVEISLFVLGQRPLLYLFICIKAQERETTVCVRLWDRNLEDSSSSLNIISISSVQNRRFSYQNEGPELWGIIFDNIFPVCAPFDKRMVPGHRDVCDADLTVVASPDLDLVCLGHVDRVDYL